MSDKQEEGVREAPYKKRAMKRRLHEGESEEGTWMAGRGRGDRFVYTKEKA